MDDRSIPAYFWSGLVQIEEDDAIMKCLEEDGLRPIDLSFKDLRVLDDLKLMDRAMIVSTRLNEEFNNGLSTLREIKGPMDRTVLVRERGTGEYSNKVMFGSNNYLGLANDPRVKKKALDLVDQFGVGLGGPPMLNGRTSFHIDFEERLSKFKGTEDTMLFSSGFLANLGWITAMVRRKDVLILDELAHASMIDGTKMMKGECLRFPHNDVEGLRSALASVNREYKVNKLVVVEGVYSMDGDIPPLPEIVEVVKEYDALLIVDDAHGTGVLGENGKGVLEHFGLEGEADLIMGTFSKALASTGGFISGNKDMIDYLRVMARPYIFSASPPPIHLAGVVAAFEVMIEDPGLRSALHQNRRYLQDGLAKIGHHLETPSAIIPLYLGEKGDIRSLSREFEESGLFMNAIEFPAVPFEKQRFRISLMATHTRADMDLLVDSIETIGSKEGVFREGG